MVSDGSGPAASGPAATADWAFEVGKAFASQYYTVMHTQPHDVHKFYVDESKFTRAERLGIPGETVTTMQGIHTKVMSLDSCEVKAEIKSVDCQESLSGGVLVVVTGAHCYSSSSGGPGERRGFVQSFFLAPQQNGFYVLNDIFRFLEDAPPPQPPAVVKHAVGGGTKSAASAPGSGAAAAAGSGSQAGLVNGHAADQAAGSREVTSVDHAVRDVTVDEASQASAAAAAPSAAAGGAGAPPAADDGAAGEEVQVIREVPESVVSVNQGQGQGQGAGAGAAAAAAEAEKAEPSVVSSAPVSAPAVLPSPAGGEAAAGVATQAPGAAASAVAQAVTTAPTAAAAPSAVAVAPVAAVAPAAAAAPAVAAAPAAAAASDEPAPKKSYASILQAMRAQSAAASPAGASAGAASAPGSATPPAAAPLGVGAPRQPPLLPAAAIGGAGAFGGQEAAPSQAAAGFSAGLLASAPGFAAGAAGGASEDTNAADEAAGEGRAVFVRNLPVRITAKEIAEHFSQFGAVKADRIQIRGNKANNPATVYAFVEFEEPAAAQAAVEKQTIMVGNFQVKIEEKKASSTNRGSYRRTGGGRGGSDRQFRDGSSNFTGAAAAAAAAGAGARCCPRFDRLFPSGSPCTTLEELWITNCGELERFPNDVATLLPSLRILSLDQYSINAQLPEELELLSLTRLELLKISNCKGLFSLPEDFGCLTALKTLVLERLPLEDLPQSLCRLSSLKTLFLIRCPAIRELPVGFCCLTAVKTLWLVELPQIMLPAGIEGFKQLQTFYLNDNQTQQLLPSSFTQLSSLTRLELNSCSLLKLPEDIQKLRSLRELFIISCQIEELPESLTGISGLEILTVNRCERLHAVPSKLESLSRLEVLKFEECENLTELPEFLPQSLEELNLGNSRNVTPLSNVTVLPKLRRLDLKLVEVAWAVTASKGLSRLEHLHLESCNTKKLPFPLAYLSQLRTLTIGSAWRVEALPDFGSSMVQLRQLRIHQANELKELPASIVELPRLTTLEVHAAKLVSLPKNLGALSRLQELNLSKCSALEHLPASVTKPAFLCRLDVEDSLIRSLPPGFERLARLHSLNLKGCKQLESLPENFTQLKSLRDLFVGGCSKLLDAEGFDWVAAECGEEHRRRAKVLWKWLYRDAHWAESVDDMAGVSRSFLSLLASSGARFSSLRLHSVRTAADGTKKVLFELSRDADLPPTDRPRRLGVLGCAMGCQFCFTAKMGLQRNLTAGEIVDQVVQIRRLFTEEVGPVTNLVFMGMGEPLQQFTSSPHGMQHPPRPSGRPLLAGSHHRVNVRSRA
ncbi:unnamed protein product [Closterium sp. Yama58-4]|nr:unnamed protein product [Closterium sp. Yama58-4]